MANHQRVSWTDRKNRADTNPLDTSRLSQEQEVNRRSEIAIRQSRFHPDPTLDGEREIHPKSSLKLPEIDDRFLHSVTREKHPDVTKLKQPRRSGR
jgi:hypothetical protein